MTEVMRLSDRETDTRARNRDTASLPCCAPESALVLKASLADAAKLLNHVDELGVDQTGALVFDEGEAKGGAILVESRRICWAAAPGLKRRLVEVLRHQMAGPIDSGKFEQVFRDCKEKQMPFGETLVEKGLVSEAGLRRALRQHTAEAIARLASAKTHRFLPHRKKSYNPTFSFSTAEILCSLGALRDVDLAAEASNRLRQLLPAGASGAVYSRDLGANPVAVGLWEEEPFSVRELGDIASWASGVLDIGGAIGEGLRLISASDTSGRSVALWQDDSLMYAALCRDSKSLARVLMGVSRR